MALYIIGVTENEVATDEMTVVNNYSRAIEIADKRNQNVYDAYYDDVKGVVITELIYVSEVA